MLNQSAFLNTRALWVPAELQKASNYTHEFSMIRMFQFPPLFLGQERESSIVSVCRSSHTVHFFLVFLYFIIFKRFSYHDYFNSSRWMMDLSSFYRWWYWDTEMLTLIRSELASGWTGAKFQDPHLWAAGCHDHAEVAVVWFSDTFRWWSVDVTLACAKNCGGTTTVC